MNKVGALVLTSLMLGGSFAQADRVRVVPRSGGSGGGEDHSNHERRDERPQRGRSETRRVQSQPADHRLNRGQWRRNHVPAELPVVRNRSFEREVGQRSRVEVVPNRYYWHDYRGDRYAHYYRNGTHWYGFYHGPRFYWTQYHRNRWWWYDPVFAHWTFWWNGYWWWNAPGGISYVYINNAYQPYDAAGIDVSAPETAEAPPEGTPPGRGEESSVTSPDGKRLVQIAGDEDEAFLYDTTSKQPVFMKVLGKGVSNARISGGADGTLMQILINFQDGRFALYNSAGEPARVQ